MLGLVGIITLGLFNSLDDASRGKMESILHLYSRGDEHLINPKRETE